MSSSFSELFTRQDFERMRHEQQAILAAVNDRNAPRPDMEPFNALIEKLHDALESVLTKAVATHGTPSLAEHAPRQLKWANSWNLLARGEKLSRKDAGRLVSPFVTAIVQCYVRTPSLDGRADGASYDELIADIERGALPVRYRLPQRCAATGNVVCVTMTPGWQVELKRELPRPLGRIGDNPLGELDPATTEDLHHIEVEIPCGMAVLVDAQDLPQSLQVALVGAPGALNQPDIDTPYGSMSIRQAQANETGAVALPTECSHILQADVGVFAFGDAANVSEGILDSMKASHPYIMDMEAFRHWLLQDLAPEEAGNRFRDLLCTNRAQTLEVGSTKIHIYQSNYQEDLEAVPGVEGARVRCYVTNRPMECRHAPTDSSDTESLRPRSQG